jgi:hypothetical protein
MIARLERSPLLIADELKRSLGASLTLIEGDARTYAPRDQGRLAGSINWHIEGSGLSLIGHVGPSVNYGAPVEFGRRAGARMPPVLALVPWVQRHWRSPSVNGQRVLGGEFLQEVGSRATNRRTPPRSVSDRQIVRRAFALARAIERRGIRRRPYLSESYNKNRQTIFGLFMLSGRSYIASLAGKQL